LQQSLKVLFLVTEINLLANRLRKNLSSLQFSASQALSKCLGIVYYVIWKFSRKRVQNDL